MTPKCIGAISELFRISVRWRIQVGCCWCPNGSRKECLKGKGEAPASALVINRTWRDGESEPPPCFRKTVIGKAWKIVVQRMIA